MVVKVQTCVLSAFQFRPVTVETDLSPQLPTFSLVGLASSMTQESRERVRSAVSNSGFEWPGRKVTVNLVPADLPKWGSHFELPMALSIVLAGLDREEPWPQVFAFGELSLGGDIRPSRLGLALVHWIHKGLNQGQNHKFDLVIVHPDDLNSLQTAPTPQNGQTTRSSENAMRPEVLPARSLKEAMDGLLAFARRWRPAAVGPLPHGEKKWLPALDLQPLRAVEGESLAIIAALVALAHDRHHLLLAGPHGVGKSMIAKAISVAQGLSCEEELAERIFIDQAFGMSDGLDQKKPAVFLQATMTRAALEGAVLKNGQALPGELSRAHGGLLVMDEFLEFRRDALECLRQPMEEGCIRLQRAQYRALLPSRFQLVATTNLCPCGHWGGVRERCRCASGSLAQYHRKLSGPLLDRFDLIVALGIGDEWHRRVAHPHARALIEEILGERRWDERLAKAQDLCRQRGNERFSPARGLAPVSGSRRGQMKLQAVAQTLAALEGVATASEHHEVIAGALRLNFEKFINNNSLYKLE